jgi:tetratricopeptide (TPR) repeat protein
LEFRLIPNGAFTVFGYPSLRFIRTRTFLGVLGGPFANLAAAVLAMQFLFLKIDSSSGIHGNDFLFIWFGGINVFFAILSLVPISVRLGESTKSKTDGLLLATVPFLSDEALVQWHSHYFQTEGDNNCERARYEEALRWFETGLAHYPNDIMLQFRFGNIHVRLGRFSLCRDSLLPILERADLHPLYRPTVLDTVAWANLMRGEPELLPETDRFSKEAFEAFPWSSYFAGTRGAVLVELGQAEAGLVLLRKAFDKNPDAYNRAVNACYLALGEAQLGNRDAASNYLETARKLDPKCPVSERIAERVNALG